MGDLLSDSLGAPLGWPRSLFKTRGRVSEQQLLAFRNISLSECCARYFLVLSNMFIRHTAGRMCGDIMLAECSSALSCLWCLRTALGGEPSWLLGCRCTGAPRIPHSDLIRLRMYEDILLSECSSAFSGLWCRRTVLGGEPSGRLGCRCTGAPRIPHSDLVRLPSTQHIPTTVILSLGCLGRVAVRCLGRVAVGCLGRVAVWNLGVVPSGLSPHGVASFVHARSGAPTDRNGMVCNPFGPCPPTCSRPAVVPHVPSPPPGLRLPFWRASWCASSDGGVEP